MFDDSLFKKWIPIIVDKKVDKFAMAFSRKKTFTSLSEMGKQDKMMKHSRIYKNK